MMWEGMEHEVKGWPQYGKIKIRFNFIEQENKVK